MDKVRIIIVEDHAVVRAGIRSILEKQDDFEVIAEAREGNEAIEKVAQFHPDIVLMDITMPGMGGLEATGKIKSLFPGVSILILTMHDDEQFFFPILRAGASGYVLKEAEPAELIGAIRVVCRGLVYLAPSLAKTLLEDFINTPAVLIKDKRYLTLTRREREILKYIAHGYTNNEIAEILYVSKRTAEKHRQNIMEKLGLDRSEEITKYAIRYGIIDLNE